jgi:ATP-dependent RNA helicase RhlE
MPWGVLSQGYFFRRNLETFQHFQMDARLQAAVKRLGFTEPTPIQHKAIPPALEGKDLVGTAMTGTGKTLAFALPILHRLLTHAPKHPGKTRALILAPTRELALQIDATFKSLLPGLPLKSATVFGGVGFQPQEQALRGGVQIIVACPGRLLDHVGEKVADLRHVEVLVLDEADQMFDMGFLPQLKQIVSHLSPSHERQTLFFSATFAPELLALVRQICKDPARVDVSGDQPVHTVAHALYPVPRHLKTELLLKLVKSEPDGTILIFTRTKHRANRIGERLDKAGWKAGILHSNKSQNQRQAALEGFRNGSLRMLVATDIAARGIDVAGVTHVINYDVPETATTYIHRIGRTGRAQRNGDAITLYCQDDQDDVVAIERALGKPIERRALNDFDYKAAPPPGASQEFSRPPLPRRGGFRGGRGRR